MCHPRYGEILSCASNAAMIPTAPAILNALYDAAGVRIRKLPATPDKVRAAILAKAAAGSGNSHA